MPPEMSSATQTSSELKPEMSRSAITCCCAGGSSLTTVDDQVERLAPEQRVLGQRLPVGRVLAPVAGERVVRAAEAVRVDRRLVALGRERGERHAARLARAARLRDVRDDPDDPGAQRRAALEAVQPLEDAEPRLLHDLLGDGARLHVAARDREHRPVVALDERLERALVAGAQAGEQLGLLGGDEADSGLCVRGHHGAPCEPIGAGPSSMGRILWGRGAARHHPRAISPG